VAWQVGFGSPAALRSRDAWKRRTNVVSNHKAVCLVCVFVLFLFDWGFCMDAVWLARFQFYSAQLSVVTNHIRVLLAELEEFCEECGPMCICGEV
jgi:hypothetical protein